MLDKETELSILLLYAVSADMIGDLSILKDEDREQVFYRILTSNLIEVTLYPERLSKKVNWLYERYGCFLKPIPPIEPKQRHEYIKTLRNLIAETKNKDCND